jgi:thiol-disulfide isomerase/thioredoxin
MKLIWIFAVCVILFNGVAVDAADMVGRDVPRINVRQWITPNPPTRANLEEAVYVLEFWATWCPACVQSVPHMIELADKYSEKGVIFIALSKDRSVEELRKFLSREKINYHIGMDDGINKKFSIDGIPTAFVISHIGRVVWQGHPMSRGCEDAIVNALEAVPEAFLAGVKLGPFEGLRLQLSGGTGFVKSYRQLRIEAKKDSEDGKIALEIINAIDGRLEKKIEEAAKLRETDPVAAFELYSRIVKKYRGIELVGPAVAAHDELKNDKQVESQLEAAKALEQADRLLAKCRGCSACGDFNPGCKKCAQLNRTTLDKAEEVLTGICKNYKDTKAAETARQRLSELGVEVLQDK